MTDYVYVNKGGGGVFRKGQLGPIGQGTIGIDLVIQALDLAQEAVDLTGYATITGKMERQSNGDVTAIEGTLTLVSTGSTGRTTWVVTLNDSGTPGLFDVVFRWTNGTDVYVSLPAELLITENPGVSASSGPPLVGIPQATSDWLDDEKTAVETADAGEILESDGTNSRGTNYLTATSLRKNNYTAVTAPGIGDDTADGYAPGSRWIDTVGDESYTCVDATLGAAIWKSATSAGIANIVEDTTPQLGGDLDLNGNVITGMVIGTDVQAFDAGLSDLAGLAVTDGNIPVGNGANWVAESGATALASLGAAAASDLSTHESLTTSAHGGLIPQDALIISKTEGYQVASGDAGKIIECSGTFSVTFPNGLDTGFQVTVVNVGAGVITLAASTTLQSDGTQLETQYTGASVYHRGSNVWLALGRLT